MSAVFSLIFLSGLFVITFSFAFHYWQRKKYSFALRWALGAYFFFGLGITFAAQYYVSNFEKDAIASGARPELIFAPDLEPLVAGKPAIVTAAVRNTGNATAYHVRVCSGTHIVSKGFDPRLDSLLGFTGVSESGPEFIPPVSQGGAYFDFISVAQQNMSDYLLDLVNRGEFTVYFVVRGQYEDISGKKYPIKLCYLYVAETRGMTLCSTHVIDQWDESKWDCFSAR